jgi:hypothetical protein
MRKSIDDDPIEEFIRTLQRVIQDWGIFELFMVIIFLPFSLLYIAFRMIQEMR